jgi:hypothetical protein
MTFLSCVRAQVALDGRYRLTHMGLLLQVTVIHQIERLQRALDVCRYANQACGPWILLEERARTGLLWAFSRSRLVKDVGEFGPLETRHLIDDMVATEPDRTRRLRALRP